MTQLQQSKQRIHRIKTEHDDSAKIDSLELLQEQKRLHQQKIAYSLYADSITDNLFPIKPLQVGFIQSIALKDDPKFKEIKHIFKEYNEQAVKSQQKSVVGLHLKTVVMDSMLKFVRLMLQAPDISAKKRILDISYYWFKKNLQASSQVMSKKTKNSLQSEVRSILIDNKLLPKAIIEKELPSVKLAHELKHYRNKARTFYPELDGPKVELQNYITHKLGFANHKNHDAQRNVQTQDQKRELKWKERIVFKKPFIRHQDQTSSHAEDVKAEPQQIEQIQSGQVANNQEQVEIKIGPDGQEIKENVAAEEVQQIGEDFGLPPEEGDENEDIAEEQPELKKGKLDPLVKIFLMDRTKRAKTEGQVSADHVLKFKKNVKLQNEREDKINSSVIQQWAGNRSRFKSELSRKIQSIRADSRASYSKRENSLRVENTINKRKLNETLKEYKDYINIGSTTTEQALPEQSMSIYGRGRIKTQNSKTFSSIMQDRKRIDQKNSYLDEMQDLKYKFAKYKLYTPLDNFKKAITHPEEKDCVWSELDKVTSDKIELPRCNMISNPFIKAAKKKKKKGAKKR